ncbi:hypothetical protein H0H92_001312 [Tricholoma furcatifolium]|nr:hypothetical protein H0H92_001312 [Tricholoma furcatifolium]
MVPVIKQLGVIEVSSSPEPEPSTRTVRVKNFSVIELSDDDDDDDALPQKQPVAGPSSRRRPRPQQLGSSSSVENIPPPLRKKTTPVPLFLPSDEENNPLPERGKAPTPAPFPLDVDADFPTAPKKSQPLKEPSPEPEQPEPVPDLDPDPQTTMTARVLEIIPDVEPDFLHAKVTQHMLDHPDQDAALIVERILHALFEDNKYPKVDRFGKGKRKQEDSDGTASKKTKIDYTDKNRPNNGGTHYNDLALERLQTSFPFVPKPYLRQMLSSNNGFYSPAHLSLIKQEEEYKRQREAGERVQLPYTRRTTPYRPKGKLPATRDEELERECAWLLDHLSGLGGKAEVGEDEDEDDGECEDGVECGCCFSTYRFDKMIQCPETHLFCMSCMRSYASNLLGEHDPNIKCMDQSGCKALIPPSELRRFLSEKLMDLYERVKQRKEVEAAGLEGLEECPFCEWGCVIENPDEKLLRCGNFEMCGAVSCRGCKKLDHLPKSCKEMEEDKHLDGRHAVEEAMSKVSVPTSVCDAQYLLSASSHAQLPQVQKTFYQGVRAGATANAGGSSDVNAGKCLLWDNVEQRHVNEVKAAAELAQENYKRDNPDVDHEALKVDLPVAPPPSVNPYEAARQQRQRELQAALDRALAEFNRLRNQEEAHQVHMRDREAGLALLREAAHRMPHEAAEYQRREYVLRAEMANDHTIWYQIRNQLEHTRLRVDQCRMAVAQWAHDPGYAAMQFAVPVAQLARPPPAQPVQPRVHRPRARARAPRRR